MDGSETQNIPESAPRSPYGSFATPEDIKLDSAEDMHPPTTELITKVEEDVEDVPMLGAEIPPEADVRESTTLAEPSPPSPPAKPLDLPNGVPAQNDTPNYKTTFIMSGHTRAISCVKFNPEGTMLASAGERGVQSVSRVFTV